MPAWSELTLQLIRAARDEDLGGTGDLTAALLPADDEPFVAQVVPRVAGVAAGLALAPAICAEFAITLDSSLAFETIDFQDGDQFTPRQPIARVRGPRGAVLTVERTLLNFLGRMCGVATLTRQYVEAARRGSPTVQVLDTRKTLPGWRELDKYAVVAGGGVNHRFGLFDAVLIKDNHIAGVPVERLAGYVFEMLNRLSQRREKPSFVEVEVDSLEQLDALLRVVGIDYVLLDNFTNDKLREAVRRRDAAGLRGKLALEASGGVNLNTIEAIAATGVERISVGALTHSAVNLDIGLDA